jgi:RNA polymerase sigma-70 factor (ECF subfamily)
VEALDFTLDIFLMAYRKLEPFDGSGTLKPGHARIAIHAGNTPANSASRRLARPAAWHGVREDHTPPSQDLEILAGERRRQVATALDRLAPRHRLAIELRYLQEMPIRDVAAALECSEGVARNILFRGLRKLRQQLAQAS